MKMKFDTEDDQLRANICDIWVKKFGEKIND